MYKNEIESIIEKIRNLMKDEENIVIHEDGIISTTDKIDYEFKYMIKSYTLGEFIITLDEHKLISKMGPINNTVSKILKSYLKCDLFGKIKIIKKEKKIFDNFRREQMTLNSNTRSFVNGIMINITGTIVKISKKKYKYLLKYVTFDVFTEDKFNVDHLWFSTENNFKLFEIVHIKRKLKFYYKNNLCKLGIQN